MDLDQALAFVRPAVVAGQARDLLRALDADEPRWALRVRAVALISSLESESPGAADGLDDGDVDLPVLASDPGEYRRWQGLLRLSGLAADQQPEPADDVLPDRPGVELPEDVAARERNGHG